MIAHIIPYQKTPRGTDVFTYLIPEHLSVVVGDIVWVPLRSHSTAGLVWKIEKKSAHKKLKSIVSVSGKNWWHNPQQRELLSWFAQWYGVSLATAWKTMQWDILKRPKKGTLPLVQSDVCASTQPLALKRSTALIFNDSKTAYNAYHRIIHGTAGHVLIVAPEYSDVEKIAQHISHRSVIAYTTPPSPSDLYTLMETLQDASTQQVVIATKKMALAPIEWGCIIIDQEEAKSQKQYDANPRYHVRSIAAHRETTAVYASCAPSMFIAQEMGKKTIDILDLRERWDKKRVTIVNMNDEYTKKNYTWFSDELQEQLTCAQRSFLFLNRTGSYTIGMCKECGTLVETTTLQCPTCYSHNIRLQGKGTETIEKELHALFPKKRIVRIDRSVDEKKITANTLENAEIIIGTEKAFRYIALDQYDCVGVLSVDHLLLYPHFQASERVWQLLSTLCCESKNVIIQTYAPTHPVIDAVARNDVHAFLRTELAARKTFSLPPTVPYIRFINTRTRKTRVIHEEFLDTAALQVDEIVDRQE